MPLHFIRAMHVTISWPPNETFSNLNFYFLYDKFAKNIVQELVQNAHGDIQTRTDRLTRVVVDLKFKKLNCLRIFPETVNYANCGKRNTQIAWL